MYNFGNMPGDRLSILFKRPEEVYVIRLNRVGENEAS